VPLAKVLLDQLHNVAEVPILPKAVSTLSEPLVVTVPVSPFVPDTEVTVPPPVALIVTAPVVWFTEIPEPAETEVTLAFVLTGAVVCVVASLNVTVVPDTVIAIFYSFKGFHPQSASLGL
jgi:hypothetical protein